MSHDFDNTPQHRLTLDGRVFAVKDIEQEAEFEILSFEDSDGEEVNLVCLGARRIFHMSHVEAESLAAKLLNAVAEARAFRSPQSPPQL